MIFNYKLFRLINQRNSRQFLTLRNFNRIGKDQGVNLVKSDFKDFDKNNSNVSTDVIEYTRTKLSLKEADGFEKSKDLLKQQKEFSDAETTRWINVEGRNIPLLREIALKFNLHPLSIEDVIFGNHATRPKAEYFSNALFVTLPLHSLGENNINHPTEMHSLMKKAGKFSRKPQAYNDKGELLIDIQLLSIFLLRDGTIISIFERPQPNVLEPLVARVKEEGTVVRDSSDASMLLQALLDVTVDHAINVVTALEKKLAILDEQVLEVPTMETIRSLHRLRGQFLELKRTLTPLHNLIYTLKDLDGQKAAFTGNSPSQGFMSIQARTYLQDVADHVDWLLSALDMFSSLSENLVSLSFNSSSFKLNETIKTLTVFSVICMPLSLITSYFGMNFENFWCLAAITCFVTTAGIYIPQLKSKMLARKLMHRRSEILRGHK
ncbi:hypothetical protein E3Q22_03932 [Wallemia mellicola]|uniref:Magnesium transporter n=1 Tax=Wallemia mellicola TaxID=1708541 RepID=A0A4T0N3E3_9BASI|nr:hypothetical protein E3Q24_01101 [Wallemia mellicola]TIB75626.1 hypothetical protein E3Q22_03932 [Wallemia mellicola]TIB87982.1 hypothetical protein E3Q21_01153 [Wallemia mellicola]TIB90771.1 hypothetical protein E3Q20_01140 [Wallemia mellicola]TIB96345.1 hypothetical protein E3Q17_03910 [Wallemia mellicola]